MSGKTCPFMAIAQVTDQDGLGLNCTCLEFNCVWWIEAKKGYDCAFVLLARSIEAIGQIKAYGKPIPRRNQ